MEALPISRRRFLRGRMHPPVPVPRPPWALVEAAFIDRCTRCKACIEACPTRILVPAEGGFPAVDFSAGECTFCGECVTRCEPGALQRAAHEAPPWSLRVQIGEGCIAAQGVECRVCGEACPVGAIRFRPRRGGVALPEADLQACTGCGACFAPCPVQAVKLMAINQQSASVPMEGQE